MNQTIGVNITPQSFQPTLHYSQGDVGRVFVVNVTDYDIPSGATVTCVATKPSGMGFTVSGTVSGNSVTFTSTAEMTDEWGRFPAEIRIASGNTLLGTANFLMIGEKDPHPASTIDGTQEELIPQLTLLVNRVEAAAESVHDLTVSATTLTAGSDATATYDSTNNSIAFGIPRGADGDVTRSEFNDLKSDILENASEEQFLGNMEFEIGGLDASDGTTFASTNRIRTVGYIDSSIIKLVAKGDYVFLVFAYNNGTYVGSWDGDTFWTSGTAYTNNFDHLPKTYQYKLLIKRTNNAVMSLDEVSNISYCTSSIKPVDDAIDYSNGLIQNLQDVITNEESDVILYKADGLENFQLGALDGSGAEVEGLWNGMNSARSLFIPIPINGSAVKSNVSVYSAEDYFHYVCFYDDSKAFINRSGGEQLSSVTADIPNNAKYFRVTLSFIGVSNISDYNLKVTHPSSINIVPYLYNKSGIILGDSISYGLYSYWDGNQRKNSDGLTPDYAPKKISDYFGELCGMSVTNIARRGTGYVADSRNLGNALVKANATDFSGYAFVGLCFGVNDYIQNKPLGSIEGDAEGTVVGNLMRVLKKIYADNPLAKVVIFSPYNTWGQVAVNQGTPNYYGDESTNYALGHTNSAGYTLQQLVDAIDEVADYYGVTHEKLNKSNVVNRINIKDIMIDGLHPSLESLPMLAAEMFAQKDFG